MPSAYRLGLGALLLAGACADSASTDDAAKAHQLLQQPAPASSVSLGLAKPSSGATIPPGPDALKSAEAVQSFRSMHPSGSTVVSADGSRLIHASGFSFDSGARRPEQAASAFLGAHGAAFGVLPRHSLALKGAPASGEVGAVRYERQIDGLPVFGGDLAVGVDPGNRVFVVNSGDVPSAIVGRHLLAEETAISSALSSFADGVLGAGPATVEAGWKALGTQLRAVYRVEFTASEPAGDWRVFVDGEDGEALFRENLRRHATAEGTVFEVSPTETAASICPVSGTKSTLCASPVKVTFPNLSTGADLTGSQTTVYNCKGASYPTGTGASAPGPCTSVSAVNGAFNFGVDSSYVSKNDDFAAAMAYYHVDKHVTFLRALDAAQPTGKGRALRGSLPVLVNAYNSGALLDNAYFTPSLDAIVFGQGALGDFAYDATIAYHETTHASVFAWGDYLLDVDALGALDEPSAVDEGTADALASAENGRSQIASFIATRAGFAQPFMRDLSDPDAMRICKGDGRRMPGLLSNTWIANGLDGESHDDGQIWSGFYWEVYQGLKGFKACQGACDVGPALQYKAIQLAGGKGPTFGTYWQDLKAAASAMFPSDPRVATYVDCVARRRGLDQCDRTAPIFSGEVRQQYVRLMFAPFQLVLPVTTAESSLANLSLCSAVGNAATLFIRKDKPVQVNRVGDKASIDSDYKFSLDFTRTCPSGLNLAFPSSGTWYLLLYSKKALAPNADVFQFQARNGVSSRPGSQAPLACAPPPALLISPDPAAVPPRGGLTFTATAGSGTGYTWSLATNASGGSITAAGKYTAGSTAQVTDVARVVDSIGSFSFRNVTITQGVSISPITREMAPGATLAFAATGGSGTGYLWSLATNASGGSMASSGLYTARLRHNRSAHADHRGAEPRLRVDSRGSRVVRRTPNLSRRSPPRIFPGEERLAC